MPPPRKLVTLGDVTIDTDDVALLMPPAWLNDHIISFWLEHLRIHQLNSNPSVAILLPNLVYLLSVSAPDDQSALLASLDIRDKHLVLFPLNDAAQLVSHSSTAGTHWSLLVLQPALNQFFHLDSLASSPNTDTAKSLVDILTRSLHLDEPSLSQPAVGVQTNSYDCGAYLCVFAEHVVQQFLRSLPMHQLYASRPPPTAADVEQKRQQIGQLACQLVQTHGRS